MKHIICILISCLFYFGVNAQGGAPSQTINGWIKNTHTVPDSGTVVSRRDTLWIPTKFGMTVTWPRPGVDTTQWIWVGNHWIQDGIRSSGDSSFVYVDYIPTSAPTYNEGRLFYDDANKTLSLFDAISGTSLQIGQEEYVRARNVTGSQINDASAVYVSGASGLNPTIALARANAGSTSEVIGIATHNIANNSVGKVTTFGLVNDINTSSFSEGDQLFLSATTAGVITNVVPDTPNLSIFIGYCLNSHITQGKIFVRPQRNLRVYQLTDTSFVASLGSSVDTIIIPGSASGSGTVTSVGLSMPSAFTVTGSPITSGGTFGVSGAGTSLQYIRGNGTLATFDTTAIPDFYVKVRSQFSATSPITYNSTTGVFGMADIITAGACVNCNVTFDAKGRATAFSSGNPALVNNGISISATGDTTQLGGLLTKTTFIRTVLNRSDPDALTNKFLFISNVPGDSSAYSNYFINSNYDRPGLIVNRQYGNDDTLYKQYGGAIQAATKMVFDASNTKYKDPSTPFTMTYGGANMLSQIFPPDTSYMRLTVFGNTGSVYSGDIGIGGENKYNLTILSTLAEYPFSVYRSGVDYARSTITVKRELRGNPSGGYVSDWRSQSENINSGTTEYGSYVSKNFGFMAYGTISPQLTSPSKAKTLAVSTVDTAIGFWARPMWTTLNEVKNGYGFVNEGTADYNHFAGLTKFGGTMPSVDNPQTRRVVIDSTLQVGQPLPFSTNSYISGYWNRKGLTSGNFASTPNRGAWFTVDNVFTSNATSIVNSGATALRTEYFLYADSVQDVFSQQSGVGLMGATIGIYLRKGTGYLDTTTWKGGATADKAASALQSRFDLSDGFAASGMPNIGTGYFSSFNPTFQFNSFNTVDHAIWVNVGIAQYQGTTNANNGYGVYIHTFPSQVANKYAIYQAGTLDTVLVNGKLKLSNLTAPPGSYNILVHGTSGGGDSTVYQVPTTAFATGNTLYTGDGTLPSDRNVASGGFTLRLAGANNSDTLMSIVNSGTSSVGLYSLGSLYGVDAQSTTIGIRAFGSSTGMTAEGGTNEGAIIKSDAIRGITIQSVPATTNTVQEVARLERGVNGSPGADGIGGSANFYNKVSDNSSVLSNEIISKFTTATVGTRVSQLSFTGVNSAVTGTILTIDGDGSFTTVGKRNLAVTTSSAGTLTLANAEAYIFNGTTTTWTLPAVSGTSGRIYYIKNIGSGSITLNADSGNNEIYSSSAVNTVTVTAGSAIILISNGVYFTVN